MDDPQFGSRLPGVTYLDRPGVYAVVIRDGLLLAVETAAGYYLPGGGVDHDEAAEVTLQRELLEETGLEAVGLTIIGTARQYVVESKTGIGYNKIETFYRVTDVTERATSTEPDHAMCWMPVSDALGCLREEAQAWAVKHVSLSS